MVGQAHNVARISLVRDGALLREEELRRGDRHHLAGAHQFRLHAARQLARTHAHKGDAVTMVGVHVRLNLEHEAGHLRLARLHHAGRAFLRARRRREGGQRVDEILHAERAQRGAPVQRRQMPFKKSVVVERFQRARRQLQLLAERRALMLGQHLDDLGVGGPVDRDETLVGIHLADGALHDVIRARKRAPAPDGPRHRRNIQRQRAFNLVDQFKRIARLAIKLVDECDDGNVAHAADFEQLARARLDALGRVDHHDSGINRRERAIGVFRKVFVARRVEQVEDAIAVLERHHRRDDGNSALALDAHPVRARLATVRLGAHFARKLDGAAKQQQLLGQRRLARVRVRDDGERSAPADWIGGGH